MWVNGNSAETNGQIAPSSTTTSNIYGSGDNFSGFVVQYEFSAAITPDKFIYSANRTDGYSQKMKLYYKSGSSYVLYKEVDLPSMTASTINKVQWVELNDG